MFSPQNEESKSLLGENNDHTHSANTATDISSRKTVMVDLAAAAGSRTSTQFGQTRTIAAKERTQKKIALTDEWRVLSQYLGHEDQRELMNDVYSLCIGENVPVFDGNRELCIKTMYRQIHDKIAGYKYQDVAKKIYDETAFVNLNYTVQLLVHSSLECYYCREGVKVLYEHVKDEKQWSLERIDNSMGHNTGNVEIACLRCNLRRRTMYHERYLETKQLKFVKVDITKK